MRSTLLVLSSIAALMAAAPSVATAQRIVYRDCAGYDRGCSWRDDRDAIDAFNARMERLRAREIERTARTAARNATRNADRAVDRAMRRLRDVRSNDRMDFRRFDSGMERLRDRLELNRALRRRDYRSRW